MKTPEASRHRNSGRLVCAWLHRIARVIAPMSILLLCGAAAASAGQAPAGPAGFQVPVVNSPRNAERRVVSIEDFSVQNGRRVSDWRALTAAIESCTEDGPATLVLPKRTYTFDDPEILERGGAHIQVRGAKDLVIDGQGSELIFHHIRGAFAFEDCQRVLLRNMVVDWDVRLASAGVIVAEPKGKRSVKILDEYPVDGNTPFAAVTEYDIANTRWKLNPVEVYSPTAVTMVKPQTFTSPSFANMKVGAEVVVRHYVYEAHGFNFGHPGNSDLTFENITIYAVPGHAWVGYGCGRGFRLTNCKIMLRPGAKRLVSATADGAHFGNMTGDIIIENCDFSHQGDDSVNIHGAWSRVEATPDKRTLELSSRWFWAVSFGKGDELKLCKSGNLAEYSRVRVEDCQYDPERAVFTVTLAGDLPEGIAKGDYVANMARSSSGFLIRNNFFHDHRARGMLLQARNGLVEGNRISNVMAAAIQMTTDCNYWQEGFGCENVTIRNNIIESCNYATWERHATGRHMACINLVVDTAKGLGDYPVHRNIVIEGNTITDTPGLAILIASSDSVKVIGNTITDANTQPWNGTGSGIAAKAKGSIMVTRASNVSLTGNTMTATKKAYDKDIYVDSKTTSGIVVEGNTVNP